MKRPHMKRINVNKHFKSFEELDKFNKQIEDAFSEYVAEYAYNLLYDYINKQIYTYDVLAGGHAEYSYERTYGLLNAIVVYKSADGSWRVTLDGRKMPMVETEDGLNRHGSVDGESAAGQMASFINYGVSSTIYSYQGIDYEGYVNDELNKAIPSLWAEFKIKNNL